MTIKQDDKAYIQTLAEGLRRELAPHGVDVLASAPGPVMSGFADIADMRMTSGVPVHGCPRNAGRARQDRDGTAGVTLESP